jgi:hypothetical protein
MLLIAGRAQGIVQRLQQFRWIAIAGVATFLAIGSAPLLAGRPFLSFREGIEKPLILAVEAAAAASVAVVFLLLFNTVAAPRDLDERRSSSNAQERER